MDMRPFFLDSGYIGSAPEKTELGDQITFFYGVGVPLVVREVEKDVYTIIGPAFVCGLMKGEFIKSHPPGRTFKLI
jgi:hypothetical protein